MRMIIIYQGTKGVFQGISQWNTGGRFKPILASRWIDLIQPDIHIWAP